MVPYSLFPDKHQQNKPRGTFCSDDFELKFPELSQAELGNSIFGLKPTWIFFNKQLFQLQSFFHAQKCYSFTIKKTEIRVKMQRKIKKKCLYSRRFFFELNKKRSRAESKILQLQPAWLNQLGMINFKGFQELHKKVVIFNLYNPYFSEMF